MMISTTYMVVMMVALDITVIMAVVDMVVAVKSTLRKMIRQR
jgi:hypothetical protein